MSIVYISVSIAFFFALASSLSPVRADWMPDLSGFLPSMELPADYVDFSNGMNGTTKGWAAYSSTTIGLFAPLHQDGWRFKLSGQYSHSSYSTHEGYICEKNESAEVQSNTTIRRICAKIRSSGSEALSEENRAFLHRYGFSVVNRNLVHTTQYLAERYHVGIAPGYRVMFDTLSLTAYLGLAYQNETVMPDDDTRSMVGGIWGAEGFAEVWWQPYDSVWISADGSYFTGTQSYSAELKFGYKPVSWLSLGPELAAFGDDDDASGRAGTFIRLNTEKVETTLSGGVAGAFRDDPGVYGAANFYFRF